MGIFDALMGLTRPYDEDEDFYDDEEELVDEERPQRPASPRAAGSNPFFNSEAPEYDTPEETPAPAPAARPSFLNRREGGRFSRGGANAAAPSAGAGKIVFMKPERYEDTKVIFDHLRAQRIVLMSLDGIKTEIARRILDFMAGATYASDGKISRISNGTYVITPKNNDLVNSDMMEELENNGLFF